MMIKTKSCSGSEIWIDAALVMSVSRNFGNDDGISVVNMACGRESEEWILTEDVSTLLPKIEYAKDLKGAK